MPTLLSQLPTARKSACGENSSDEMESEGPSGTSASLSAMLRIEVPAIEAVWRLENDMIPDRPFELEPSVRHESGYLARVTARGPEPNRYVK